jgi:hypothetical protein
MFFYVTPDLNGDGKQDLIALGGSYPLNGNTTPVAQPGRVYFGDGNGGFTEVPSNIFPTDTLFMVSGNKVLVADFNGDGRADIFISSAGWDNPPFPGEQNKLYLSQPNGSWIDATSTLPQLSDYSYSSAFGDINGDGSIDIFVGNNNTAQNDILPYVLLNNGSGQFALTRADIPVASNDIFDFDTGHHFLEVKLTDLDGDGRPDLIITAAATLPSFDKNLQTTILWNNAGNFTQANQTALPAPTPGMFPIVYSNAEPIDINGDGLKDLVLVGITPHSFIQIIINHGNHVFTDETSQFLSPQDAEGTWGPGIDRLVVLDFNHDGLPDFSAEYGGGDPITQSTPLVWINDGTGHFHTLKVSDFVTPGNEWLVANGHLTQTDHGYSFFTVQNTPNNGLVETGLLATTPYDVSSVPSGMNQIRNDYSATDRSLLPYDQAITVANAITAGTQSEAQYVNGLLSQVANTTIPAVAVEASMYGATGTDAAITNLATNFLPAQVANATANGLNPQVYACEAVGLAFAFGNETGSTAFANNFGPSTIPSEAAFATAASTAIFGAASTANLVNVMQTFVSNWDAFYTAHGVPGLANPTAAQIDLAARGAAWGDMVGVALANNLGPLNGQVINFLDDAAQGTAIYGASLVGQPAHQPFA